MRHPFRPAARGSIPLGTCLLAAFGLALTGNPGLRAQDRPGEPVRLSGLTPGGARTHLTDGWGTLALTLTNPNPEGRDARVLVFFSGQPDVQYGRDVWIPARSILSAWMPLGPPADQPGTPSSRELEVLLYDRTGVGERLLLLPGQERVRTRTFNYRRGGPTTAVLLDP